jgi:hypothetical protein
MKIERLIELVVMDRFQLTQAEIENYEMEKEGGLFRHLSPKKEAACRTMMEEKAKACSVFKGINDHSLLKAWEFTIASFTDYKIEFFRWNLYASLGLNHNQPGGIGEAIYRHLEEKLRETNTTTQKWHQEYERAHDQARTSESLLRNADSYQTARRLKAEHQARVYHMHSLLDMRNTSESQAYRYSQFFEFLLKEYDAKFQEYFQEIYDPSMEDLELDRFEDSPAGFRLIYKHGRSDPSQWTLIHNAAQYIHSLVSFFSMIESAIIAKCEWETGKKEVALITTVVIQHLKTPPFLESSLRRMAEAHQSTPLPFYTASMEKIEKKPWAYTSGGTPTTLLRSYFCLEKEIAEEVRKAESPTDLALFLLDLMKGLPFGTTEVYETDTQRPFLMCSPTHAFLFKPGLEPFKSGWQDRGFTYSWFRDQFLLPAKRFYDDCTLDATQQLFLMRLFTREFFPHQGDLFFSTFPSLSAAAFRNHFLDQLSPYFKGTHLIQISDALDAFLQRHLPCHSFVQGKKCAHDLLAEVVKKDPQMLSRSQKILDSLTERREEVVCGSAIREVVKYAVRLGAEVPLSFDIDGEIAAHAQTFFASAPRAFLFADTNWPHYYFGFVFNPGTEQMELWRVDRTGFIGSPMSMWSSYFDGTKRSLYSVYVRPQEYFG